MNLRFLMLLLLVGAAAITAHHTLSEPAAASPPAGVAGRNARDAANTAKASPIATSGARVKGTLGRGGAMLMGPGILGMTRRTEQVLDGLQPAVKKAPMQQRQRADRAAKQIRKLDAEAKEHLEAGRPMAAFQSAMRARGLIDAVRQQVIEESAIR
jgi:hypothetical protein